MKIIFRVLLIMILNLGYTSYTYSQRNYSGSNKLIVSDTTYYNWPSLGQGIVSNNGKYFVYFINKRLEEKSETTAVVKGVDNHVNLEFSTSEDNAIFTNDSRFLVFRKSSDSLGILELAASNIEYIMDVGKYELTNFNGNDYLIYDLNGESKSLMTRNLQTKSDNNLGTVLDWIAFRDSRFIVVKKVEENNKKNTLSLQCIDIDKNTSKIFWQHSGDDCVIGQMVVDHRNLHLAFVIRPSVNNEPAFSCRYYSPELDSAIELFSDHNLTSSTIFNSIFRFSPDGTHILYYSRWKDEGNVDTLDPLLTIWKYNATNFASGLSKRKTPRFILSDFSIDEKKSHLLGDERSGITYPSYSTKGGAMNFGLITWPNMSWERQIQNMRLSDTIGVINLETGAIKNITNKKFGLSRLNAEISPHGRFIVYFDTELQNYFAYDIMKGSVANITGHIAANWSSFDDDHVRKSPFPVAGWMNGDSTIFLYDQFDIWMIDIGDSKHPVNITNRYGAKNKIEFRFISDAQNLDINSSSKSFTVVAFNVISKDNGFYSVQFKKSVDPRCLYMGPYLFYLPNTDISEQGYRPKKAENAKIYILQSMTYNRSRNYVWTSNFNQFIPLSDVYPESNYYWYKTKLISWETFNGSRSQGILYVPEDINPQKKYPIIFYYYEQLSDGLNAFLEPELSYGALNVLWYVSHQYLVFEPDIRYKIGEPGKSAFNSVVSAALFLSKKSFINRDRMGIQGFSFGGYETNYIVAHTHLFAAACTGAGISDLVSFYNATDKAGSGKQPICETGQVRIGANLWQNGERYFKNSSIFYSDKVSTPLLLMHTTNDDAVPMNQSIEFFMALRRLNKKAWLLQYNDGNHGVNGKSALDFEYKMGQFFDYFLKDSAMPKWMRL